jgi:hypothetical protein
MDYVEYSTDDSFDSVAFAQLTLNIFSPVIGSNLVIIRYNKGFKPNERSNGGELHLCGGDKIKRLLKMAGVESKPPTNSLGIVRA